ncbi:hypothetical protein EMA8858_03981 [Emticicia aquatica]|uniref:DoxX family membrane protein n=1 Tax=Emticicia aquatica TaxID=1681835 RepID=A0ABM9AUW7_9BACT|nr:hypothetical protein [Emticicia aquatica]CAH0997847.1 hypothetical protein EMA8858_03981 [Emticicia aquatica]
MKKNTSTLDNTHSNQFSFIWMNRLALFIVFFWFGFLKIIGLSPAKDIVTHLHHQTIEPYISASFFIPFLGLTECLIGLLWLFPKLTKIAFVLFCLQMFTTFLPLILLPSETWQSNFALTLAGQYIIKNIVLIASAYTVYQQNSNNNEK